jgi:hypothetical protein
MICKIDGCDRTAGTGRGMCHKHYKRWQINGHTDLTTGQGCPDVRERLAFKSIRSESGCLEWTGTLSHRGYGQTKVNYKYYSVHKLSWELANGPVPSGMYVCHKCDNPKCFEVSHLFLGTPQDNVHDSISKGRFDPNRLKMYRSAHLEASRRKT